MSSRDIERVIGFDGKTVAKIEFDGYDNFCITFTDGTELAIRERMQAGQITWDADLYTGMDDENGEKVFEGRYSSL